ncbi:MAG: alpha/beta hydrolase [Bacillota bacterium]|nr:alpha/beta hydrolase [Bacillota bacterium]
MKKLLAAFLSLLLLLSVSACGSKEEKTDDTKQTTDQEKNQEKETETSYHDELVKVGVEGGELSGILTTPKQTKGNSMPVVLLVPGSGPVPKNGIANEFGQLSIELAKNGIASLRYDKRGSFDSNNIQIDEEKIRVNDYVQDISTLIHYLKKDNQFTDVFLLGHSQGALFGALAIKDTPVDGFISVAGAGRSIDIILKEQIKENELNTAEVVTESNNVLNKLKKGERVPEVSKLVEPLFKPSIQNYLIDWMSYDPTVAYKQISATPILIIQGKNDIQIKEKDAKLLADVLDNNKPVLIDKMSHVMKDASTKEDREEHIKIYSNVKAPLNQEFVDSVIQFINGHKRSEDEIKKIKREQAEQQSQEKSAEEQQSENKEPATDAVPEASVEPEAAGDTTE